MRSSSKNVPNGTGIVNFSWLKSAPYPVQSFVILDDKDDMAMHRQRLVRVDPKVGLGMKEARQAIALLATPWRQKTSA